MNTNLNDFQYSTMVEGEIRPIRFEPKMIDDTLSFHVVPLETPNLDFTMKSNGKQWKIQNTKLPEWILEMEQMFHKLIGIEMGNMSMNKLA
ncbi:MAG: hypothetical protein EOO02_12420 [Chitinophagaceae bacterium]|nr:MAG: hypothetical protein EOO02_12420 [Chitinophagaceae bacterium]